MSDTIDFEQAWLQKLSACLEQVVGEEVQAQVMAGSENLSTASSRQDVIRWSRQAMDRLEALVSESARRQIMTGCACQYPKTELAQIRQTWKATADLDQVHAMLQAQFESFLEEVLQLDEDLIQEIVARGWGLAGVRQENTIIATKIPKSGFLVEYMQETDPDLKRQYYCHCPRIRDVLKGHETLSTTYCYCGAGYYQGIWEEILQQPVEVELLESVLQGDQVCQVAIHLPLEA
jgi:predicted hydrocarbon binding protein